MADAGRAAAFAALLMLARPEQRGPIDVERFDEPDSAGELEYQRRAPRLSGINTIALYEEAEARVARQSSLSPIPYIVTHGMPPDTTIHRPSPDIITTNRTFYDALWSTCRLQRPDRFNTWPLVSELLPSASSRLELGPGLRPRLPIAGTHFIDISAPAIERLNARGGIAVSGEIGVLPFGDRAFDLVCAFDVIEHIEDDRRVFSEVSRVLKDDGVFVLSVPLYADRWTAFDDWVGHARRYDPADLLALLARNQLQLDKSAVFGMQLTDQRFVDRGRWWVERHRTWAMFWYNWVGMPLAMLFQKRLALVSGLIDTTGVDEMVLLCRRRVRGTAAATGR